MRTAALVGLVGYGIGWVLAFLTSVGFTLVADDSTAAGTGAMFTMPGQIVGLALLGSLHGSIDEGTTASLTLTPWFVTAVILAAVGFAAARTLSRPASTRARVVSAATTGLTLAIVSTLVAALLRLDMSSSDLGADVRFGTAGLALFFGATLLGATAAFVGARVSRGTTAAIWQRIPASIRPGLRAAWLHLWVASAILGAVLLIAVPAATDWRVLAVLPLWWATTMLDALALAHLGQVSVSAMGAVLDIGGSGSTGISLFSDSVSRWYLLAIIVTIVLAIVASVRLALLRPVRASKDWSTTWTTPAALAVVGLLIVLLGTVRARIGVDVGDSDFFAGYSNVVGGSGSVGPAPLLVLVLAAWGLVIEASSRLVAPSLMTALPARLVAFLATRAPDPEWAAVLPGLTRPVAKDVLMADAPLVPSLPGNDAPAYAVTAGMPGAPIGAQVPPAVALPKQLSSTHLGLIGALVGGVVLLCVIAAVAFTQLNSRVFGPERQVSAYMDALIAGDATAALAAADLDVPNSDRVLLTDAVLGAATDRITDYTIEDVSTTSDGATVAVEVEQAGDSYPMTFTLERDGSTAIVFARWRLVDPSLGSVEVQVPYEVESALVSGVEVAVPDGYVDLPAFPGTYEVQLPDVGDYFTSATESAAVYGSDYASVDVSYEPTDRLVADAIALVDAALDTCIAATVTDPDDCPNQAYAWQDISGVVWTLDERPTYDVSAEWGSDIYIRSDRSGSATITGMADEYDFSTGATTPTPYTDTIDIDLYASVILDGDTLTLDD